MSPFSQEMFDIDTIVDVEKQILNILFVTATFISTSKMKGVFHPSVPTSW